MSNETYPIDQKIPFLEDIESQAVDNSDAETLTETLVNKDDDELLPTPNEKPGILKRVILCCICISLVFSTLSSISSLVEYIYRDDLNEIVVLETPPTTETPPTMITFITYDKDMNSEKITITIDVDSSPLFNEANHNLRPITPSFDADDVKLLEELMNSEIEKINSAEIEMTNNNDIDEVDTVKWENDETSSWETYSWENDGVEEIDTSNWENDDGDFIFEFPIETETEN